MTTEPFVQQDQPPGVPPLSLTGERTLPDVPAENYWYRRHLAVYEWIGARVLGGRVLDMACGEGYGSAVLARGAQSVIGVDANPEAYDHARLRYRSDNLRFERGLVETHGELGAYDAVVFLQTIEHVADPAAVLTHLRSLLAPGGTVYVSTPNLLTIAPPGAEKSSNPWHVKEYRADEFDALCRTAFDRVQLLGLRHARRLRLHELALRGGWDAVHTRLGLTGWFYDRFTPAISARDFALGSSRLDRALDFLAVCNTR
jgi:SAM-dependent methyltransferase